MDQLIPDPRGYWRCHRPEDPSSRAGMTAERARWQRILTSYLGPQELDSALAEVRAAADREEPFRP